MKNGKRILEVRVKRMLDTDPDTSYLGEYSNSPTSEFSIDRMHSEDCQSLESNHSQSVEKLERIIGHLNDWRLIAANDSQSTEWEPLDEAIDTLIALQDELQECDCGGHQVSSREYRYFNPSFNYVNKQGKPSDGLTPEEVKKYTRQDYERMEGLNNSHWCYLGIRADADVIVQVEHDTPDGKKWHGTVQEITSGGLWGIESDSDAKYLAEVQSEQLAELRTQLLAVGFSRRAIAKAFKDVKEIQE